MAMELQEVCELIVDCEHKTAPVTETGFPLIRTPNVGRGFFILDSVYRVSSETFRQWTQRAVPQTGDLIMAREAPVGNVAIVPPGLQPCLGQRTLLIRPDRSKVEPGFLNYLLNGPHVQGLIHAKTNGSTVPHLNMRDVRALRLPSLPPLSVQRRIAGILSSYDDLIENCQRRIKILETMARALYREWFVHFRFPGHENHPRVASPLGEIPEGWETGRLSDVAILQRGFDLPRASRTDGEVPVLAATGVIGFHNEAKVRAPGVVTGRSGTIGQVLYVQEDFWPLNTCLWVKHFPRSEPLYAYYVLASLDLRQFNSGAAVPTLNRNDIHDLDVLVPPRDIQIRFQEIAESMMRQVRIVEHQVQVLRRTRDLLLPRLLSGQIPLDDAESASTDRLLGAGDSTPPLPPSPATLRSPTGNPSKPSSPPATAPPINDTERQDVLCTIRQVFGDGAERDRDTAVRDIARSLGYRRTGSRIHEVISGDLATAVHRGLVTNERGFYRLGFRSYEECDRDWLKAGFEAAIGRNWIAREDALRAFARWGGFGRVGPVIEETARSLINGLIREGRLETDGPERIRRT